MLDRSTTVRVIRSARAVTDDEDPLPTSTTRGRVVGASRQPDTSAFQRNLGRGLFDPRGDGSLASMTTTIIHHDRYKRDDENARSDHSIGRTSSDVCDGETEGDRRRTIPEVIVLVRYGDLSSTSEGRPLSTTSGVPGRSSSLPPVACGGWRHYFDI